VTHSTTRIWIWHPLKAYILSGISQQVYPDFDPILSGIELGWHLNSSKICPDWRTPLGLIIRGPTAMFYSVAYHSYDTTGYYGLGVFAMVMYCGKNQTLLIMMSFVAPVLSLMIFRQYIPSLESYDWRVRHAGLMAIAVIGEATGNVSIALVAYLPCSAYLRVMRLAFDRSQGTSI
jgi:hypothetical protein